MHERPKRHLTVDVALVAAAGVALACFAGVVPDATYSAALLSTPRDLSWGPTLFRAMLAVHACALLGAAFVLSGRPTQVPHSPSGEPDATRTASPRAWVVLAAICVVALVLRLYKLESDLWHDEIAALLEYARPPVGEILTLFRNQNQHMLFSLLAHGSIAIFGESAWAFRLPSALFGVASVWALFVMGRKLVGEREALFASALMAVSYHHVWFSQNGRGYIGLLFFTIVATWLWREGLDRPLWSTWIWYAIVVALGAWLHMTMVFVAVSHALIHVGSLALGRVRRSKGIGREEVSSARPFVAWALSATLTIQLHALALPEFLGSGLHEVSVPSEWTQSMWVLAESVRSLRVGFASVAVVAVGGGLALAGWIDLVRIDSRTGMALVLPGVLSGGLMVALGHNLWPRFFFFLMGFGLLIAVHGAVIVTRWAISRLPLGERRGRVADGASIAVATAMIVVSAATVPRNYALPKQSFVAAREFVESQRQPGDEVVAVGLAEVDYGRYYAPEWATARTREELEAISRERPRTWVVYTLPVQLASVKPDIWNEVRTNYSVVRVFAGTLGGGEVLVCRRTDRGA